MANKTKTEKHYVKRQEFYENIVIYLDKKKKGEKIPLRIDNYIGTAIRMIAEKYSNVKQFRNYPQTIKDEMILDAIENCFRYIHNFDPEKYDNPLAYFTMISHNAMSRRRELERAYLYTKYAAIRQHHMANQGESGTEEIKQSDFTVDNMDDFMIKFEESRRQKVAKRKLKLEEKKRNLENDKRD